MCVVLCPGPTAVSAAPLHAGSMSHDNVLLGIHFLHERSDCNTTGPGIANVAPCFWDYAERMPGDLAHMSYADFWHWWYEFERYKGDEKGMAEMDAIVDECLRRGLKVKIDLAWSTAYTNDKDWPVDNSLILGPVDVDDWMHLCGMLGRRYRGRVALWLLQGEANTRDYWPGMDIRHVQEVYRRGYDAFKRADPGTFISVSGATPGIGGINVYGEKNDREQMDRWTRDNLAACKGHYDDIPMNYFADVFGADPYGGLAAYYSSIRAVLDGLGARDVEVGSGESSFQWALDSYQIQPAQPWQPDPPQHPQPVLSEEGQAWRCNRSLAEFFALGGSKFVFWGTEFAPGGGWVWRWGLRKYQDWWGIWPAKHKVPGTNVVFGYDNPDGRTVDLRPGWTSSQTDPYHPIWHVYRFWAQSCPPGSEAVRLPARFRRLPADKQPGLLATYLQARDEVVVLVQSDSAGASRVAVDLKATAWPVGTKLSVTRTPWAIDYRVGTVTEGNQARSYATLTAGGLVLAIPAGSPFVTVRIRRSRPALDASISPPTETSVASVGARVTCRVQITNTGTTTWAPGQVRVRAIGARASWPVTGPVAPGQTVCVALRLPAQPVPGQAATLLRMAQKAGPPFGAATVVVTRAEERQAPRKLVAFREVGRVRLRWFGPTSGAVVRRYEVYRADGFERPAVLVATTAGTEWVDAPPLQDHAYWYHVVAVDARGRRSRPSNEDCAKAGSKPRLWDAVASGAVPQRLRAGETRELVVTVTNTGTRTWDLAAREYRLHLALTQQWGDRSETRVALPSTGRVAPGESVTVAVPYAPQKVGRYENHWALEMEVPGKATLYLGTPLLAETEVGDAGTTRSERRGARSASE